MKYLECIIFNVEHGLCVFVRSPNGYGLLVDCGSRANFSPVKWIRGRYNARNPEFRYFEGSQYAEMVVSHLHHDHFSDIGSFKNDKPKTLTRDKKTLKFLEEKLSEAKEEGDDKKIDDIRKFLDFSSTYTEKVSDSPDWGFEFFDRYQLPYNRAKDANGSRDKIINNRSFVLGVGFAGKKSLLPGDIEVEGWHEAFQDKKCRSILSGTNFFVASHHGHKSGFTKKILEFTGKPDVYIISAKSGDPHVDSSYANSNNSNGYRLKGDAKKSHSVSTRGNEQCSFSIKIFSDGSSEMERFTALDNLNDNQKKLRTKRTRKTTSSWL